MEAKSRFWNKFPSWESAEVEWDKKAEELRASQPIKTLKTLPNLPGITKKTRNNLRWKALKYLVTHDEKGVVIGHVFRHPISTAVSLIKSYLKKKSYIRDGDFFLYGIDSVEQFKKRLINPDSLLIAGFSYCHKPFECPSGRFTDQCIHEAENPVCRQCFIGKCVHALPEDKVVPVFIPTVHYIVERVLDALHQNPGREILYVITACELTLEMFGDRGIRA